MYASLRQGHFGNQSVLAPASHLLDVPLDCLGGLAVLGSLVALVFDDFGAHTASGLGNHKLDIDECGCYLLGERCF